MSAAHTPGPWQVRKHGTRLVIEGPNSRLVAETLEYIPSDGEAYANAELIASAPALQAKADALPLLVARMQDLLWLLGPNNQHELIVKARATLASLPPG